MVDKLIIANWKLNKNLDEAIEWVDVVGDSLQADPLSHCKVVVCPSFPFIYQVKQRIVEKNYPLFVASQTISSFESGAYTGDVSAAMLAGIVNFALLGHSERRKYFNENNTDINEKVLRCRAHGIEPVVLIRDETDEVPEGVTYFGWEPVAAIGTGNSVEALAANDMIVALRQGKPGLYGMYGGSVTMDSIRSYLSSESVYGVVIGSASLDPHSFVELLNAIR